MLSKQLVLILYKQGRIGIVYGQLWLGQVGSNPWTTAKRSITSQVHGVLVVNLIYGEMCKDKEESKVKNLIYVQQPTSYQKTTKDGRMIEKWTTLKICIF